jgi:two-component system cell cycle sensor histidine kinase/response regulator CckA
VLEFNDEELLDRLTETVSIYDHEARIRYINPAGAQAFGRPASELIGQRPWDIVLSETTTPFREAMGRVLAGGRKETVVSYIRAFERWYESDVYPFPDGALVVARDITARKVADEELAHARRLEALGRLAGGVAHDFNNLLSVILGSAELLMHRVAAADPMHGDLSEIVAAAERATLITRQLLAFGRRQRLAPHFVQLSEQIDGIEPVLHRLVGEDVQVDLDLQATLGCVHVDPGQIEQVVLNLVVNARDAMPGGGRLAIRTSNVTLPDDAANEGDEVPRGHYVKLTVSDTGEGMSDHVRAHVFEPFFTTKEPGRGTGLGLATVHGIVEQSAGFIRVQSAIGKGTAFHVYLPRADDAEETPPRPPQASADPSYGGTETVLLVEDDPGVRRYVRRTLRESGYDVLDAENGGTALLIMEQHAGPVHLLVADIVMSRMSGPQLAARLRAIRPALPALYMSGYPQDGIDEPGALAPTDAFVAKPFGPQELLRAVRSTLDRSAAG